MIKLECLDNDDTNMESDANTGMMDRGQLASCRFKDGTFLKERRRLQGAWKQGAAWKTSTEMAASAQPNLSIQSYRYH